MNNTACPLDCYDACEIVVENTQLKAQKDRYTQGFLCPHLNHYESFEVIKTPSYKGEEISLEKALEILKEMLETSSPSQLLHYRGAGNFGLMQEVTDHFFASYGATLTDGSLCDGAGEAGIVEGRGSNKNMPLSEIAKSEVVILWGRNPHTTSTHLLPLLKDKTVVVIDPLEIEMTQIADLHIQLKPHGDYVLAMLLSRFAYLNGLCDEEFLENNATEYEEFYELTQTVRIKAQLQEIDVTLGQIGKLLELVKNRKVAIVCGVGVQKYSDGADVMRAIDSFGVLLGLFDKEGCGISYLGNSKEGIKSPFEQTKKRVSKVDTLFSIYKTVFIQGANPLSQMPNTQRVKSSIEKVQNLIYFGLYENETSKQADLIIPAKSFLYKNDIRTSYSHNLMIMMNKQLELDKGISEYELASYLCREFEIKLESEEFYIEYFKDFASKQEDGSLLIDRAQIPYKNGFDTDDGEYLFLEEYDNDFDMQNKMFLITPKTKKGLNSQFNRENSVYLNSSLGYKDGEVVTIISVSGRVDLSVKNDDRVRKDCVLIYSGTKGVNNLTTSKHSLEGKSAIYQENKVKIVRG
ncbi:MAG: molybdopterin-dependent oxidoreductase [Campylobacterota bacterium]|nr:molybdopterin-dependent oxidoreductase [Campylobacterota bacterium]